MKDENKLTPMGIVLSLVLILGLLGGGAYLLLNRGSRTGENQVSAVVDSGPGHGQGAQERVPGLTESLAAPPALDPAGPYQMKDNILDVDISEYAGYAGIVVANNGLEPTENSVFFKRFGFKVRLRLTEEESWSLLNSGKVGVSVTTTDVLAVLGRQFQVTVPMLIGYSRGADAIVVAKDIKRLNQLQGKTLAALQFAETDFFVRYLAKEAGIGVHILDSLETAPDPEKINLVYTETGEAVGNAFLSEIKKPQPRLAGGVTWAPTTTEMVEQSQERAHLLVSNRNLLIISDIVVANRDFAAQSPAILAGLVEGWLEGNEMVREKPEAHTDILGKVFHWSAQDSKDELAKVHLANLPENLAYFAGTIDSAGSFAGIYQSAILAYGADLIPNAPPYERFVNTAHLEAIKTAGKFAAQKVAIAPLKSSGPSSALENDPLLTKDIRFYFQPNSSALIQDTATKDGQSNMSSLEDVMRLIQVSPGSTLMLVGHVDDGQVPKFQADGTLPQMALKAMQLSKDRADGVRKVLVEQMKAAPERVETLGKGWEKPVGKQPELNRRVEVQLYTVE